MDDLYGDLENYNVDNTISEVIILGQITIKEALEEAF